MPRVVTDDARLIRARSIAQLVEGFACGGAELSEASLLITAPSEGRGGSFPCDSIENA
ncbi:hypothetical protein PI125_g19586 [Phytophthora idaei]|nr:hypothetical protein PI125_g19586 [Phytophthora idaei]KAG3135180.1 hypothetical protein PI126_g18362 [Phytophthora idaei]